MINCVVHVQTDDRQSRFNWVDKRRINCLLEAINERRHSDHIWVDKGRINGLCLLNRSLGKSGSFSLYCMYQGTGTCGIQALDKC